MKAHHHFSDPEWDGEPIAPEPKPEASPKPQPEPERPKPEPGRRPQKVKVKLADGKARTIRHMMERAANAKVAISSHFNGKQQAFLDFVLSQYVKVGVEELDQNKLSPY